MPQLGHTNIQALQNWWEVYCNKLWKHLALLVSRATLFMLLVGSLLQIYSTTLINIHGKTTWTREREKERERERLFIFHESLWGVHSSLWYLTVLVHKRDINRTCLVLRRHIEWCCLKVMFACTQEIIMRCSLYVLVFDTEVWNWVTSIHEYQVSSFPYLIPWEMYPIYVYS